jgi:hypothetical protein
LTFLIRMRSENYRWQYVILKNNLVKLCMGKWKIYRKTSEQNLWDTEVKKPASASQVLWLKACATTPGSIFYFYIYILLLNIYYIALDHQIFMFCSTRKLLWTLKDQSGEDLIQSHKSLHIYIYIYTYMHIYDLYIYDLYIVYIFKFYIVYNDLYIL